MHISDQVVKDAQILIVDDSRLCLNRMKDILEEDSFSNLTTCQDPTMVHELFDRERPALVVLDHNMPKMTGEELLEQLMIDFPKEQVNVIVWSAVAEKDLRKRVLRKGAEDVLRKEEIQAEEVQCRVRNHVENQIYRCKLNQRNERLNEEVQERKRQLQEANLETIERLVRAAEFRDDETANHIERIGLLAGTLAEKLNLDENICSAIRYGAPMHDVGKIGIADGILQKPGSLTDEEWSEMKKHTTYGAKILSGTNIDLIEFARKIALYHHEHWNGEGYPEGLSGDAIPLEARITGVCDVFDAVLSDRPYKDAWTVDRAIDLIRKEKGQQFDPDIAECFLDNAETMVQIREDHKDGSHMKFSQIQNDPEEFVPEERPTKVPV